MIRRIALVVVALAVLVGTLTVPRRAAADSDNLVYIIPAAVGGAVALIAIIAIVVADRSEPEYEELVQSNLPRTQPPGGLRLAPACAPDAHGLPLLCW